MLKYKCCYIFANITEKNKHAFKMYFFLIYEKRKLSRFYAVNCAYNYDGEIFNI